MSKTFTLNIAVEGRDNTGGLLGTLRSGLGGLATVTGGILGANLLQNVGQGVKDMGLDAIGAYSDFEQLQAMLATLSARELIAAGEADSMNEALAASQDTAIGLISWIQELAVQSPFDEQGVSTALRTAMAYGFTAEEAKRIAEMSINVSAGMGLSSDAMGRVARALGQLQAKGKLTNEELLQLTEIGINTNEIFTREFGMNQLETVEAVKNGTLEFDVAMEALIGTLENDFQGAAQRSAGSFNGLQSSIAELKALGLRTFFGGMLSAVQPYLGAIVDFMGSQDFIEFLETTGNVIGGALTSILEQGSVVVKDFVDRFNEGESVLSILRSTLMSLVNEHLPGLGVALQFTIDNWEAIRSAIVAVVAGFASFSIITTVVGWITAGIAAWGALSGAITAAGGIITFIVGVIGGPLTLVIAGIAATIALVAVAWSNNWGGIQEKTAVALSFIKDVIQNALDRIRAWWNEYGDSVIAVVTSVFDFVRDRIQSRINRVRTIVNVFVGWFKEFWSTYGSDIEKIWSDVWDAIEIYFNGVVENIGILFDIFAAAFEGDWELFGEKLRELWDNTWDTIKDVISKLWDGETGMRTLFARVKTDLFEWWNGISWSDLGSNLVSGIMSGLGDLAEKLIGALIGAADAAKDAWNGFWGIESPARFMRESLGFMGDGALLGADDQKSRLQAAFNSLAKVASSGFTSGLSMPINVTPGFNPQSQLTPALQSVSAVNETKTVYKVNIFSDGSPGRIIEDIDMLRSGVLE